MTYAREARRAVWQPIQAAALEIAGFASELHRAALLARLGRDPGGAKFAAIAARLPDRDRRRILEAIT